MAWREPKLQDIAATLSQAELDAYRKSPDFSTAADPVDDLVKRTAAMVRSYCRKNKQLVMSPNPYEIPESLVSPAMDYAAYDVLKRQPVEMKEPRKDARNQAIELFKAVSNNEFTPESYESGENESNVSMPRFTGERHMVLDSYVL